MKNKKVSSCCGAEVGIDEHPFATSHANAFICYKCKKYCDKVEQEPVYDVNSICIRCGKQENCKFPVKDVKMCVDFVDKPLKTFKGVASTSDWEKELEKIFNDEENPPKEWNKGLEEIFKREMNKTIDKDSVARVKLAIILSRNIQKYFSTQISKAKKERFAEGQKYALGLDEERVRQDERKELREKISWLTRYCRSKFRANLSEAIEDGTEDMLLEKEVLNLLK